MSAPSWLPSRRFLVLGGSDWIIVGALFTAVQAAAPFVPVMICVVGAVAAAAGLMRPERPSQLT